MAKINGRADLEIRIYRRRNTSGYVAFVSSATRRDMVNIDTAATIDEQGAWLLLEAIRQEMEGWLF